MTVVVLVWSKRGREEAPDKLSAARAYLAAGDRANAFASAGAAFWASPSRVYRPAEAAVAREVVEFVRRLIPDDAQATKRRFEEAAEELHQAEVDGAAIAPEVLDPVADLLNDVADDRYLAGELLAKMEAGEWDLASSTPGKALW
jgi:hypothetical protein